MRRATVAAMDTSWAVGRYALTLAVAVVLGLLYAFFQLPDIFLLIGALLVGAVWLAGYLIFQLREVRAARALDRALLAEGARHADMARPDLAAEVAELRSQFGQAIQKLKTRRGGGGSSSLYALPWYVVIGPPGSGKSTALRNSDLNFAFLSTSGASIRGLGGTRRCDWWLSTEGVLLDTAGRWTSDDEDREEWLSFLDLIRRYRPRRPLEGVMATVSVADIARATEDEMVDLARRIRARVDEIGERLRVSLPVYLLVTKCDLIQGFAETFGGLSREERGQVWGFKATPGPAPRPSRPRSAVGGPKELGGAFSDPGERFDDQFDGLLDRVEQVSLARMGQVRTHRERETVFVFPRQLASLRDPLRSLVRTVFSENVFQDTPQLRGVYFTSGTQEGRPIDRVLARMSEGYGLADPQPAPSVSKSYFLKDLFRHVVFRDRGLAQRNPAAIERQRRWRLGICAAAVGVASVTAAVTTISFWRGRQSLLETRALVAATFSRAPADGVEPAARFDGWGERVKTLSSDATLGLGVKAAPLTAALEALYLARLRERVFVPVANALVKDLDRFAGRLAAAGATTENLSALKKQYDALKLHLAWSAPRSPAQPPLEGALSRWAARAVAGRWVGRGSDARARASAETHAAAYLVAMQAGQTPHLARNQAVIDRMRYALATVDTERTLVQFVVQRVDKQHDPIGLTQLVGRDVRWLRAERKVAGAFTRRAWEGSVQTLLDEQAAVFFGERWVRHDRVSDGADKDRLVRHRRALRTYFLGLVIKEWEAMLASLSVRKPADDVEAHALLRELTEGDPRALTRLFRNLDYQLRYGPADAESDPVRRTFAGLLSFAPTATAQHRPNWIAPATQYEEQLEYVRDALRARIDGSRLHHLARRRRIALGVTEALIDQRPSAWQPMLRALLVPPIVGADG